MAIDAIAPTHSITPHSIHPDPVALTADVEAFTRTLFGHLNKIPDEQAVEQFQSKAADINTRIQEVRATEEVLQSPLHALQAQTQVLGAIAEVDLIAKAVGGISQGINKLTSMQ